MWEGGPISFDEVVYAGLTIATATLLHGLDTGVTGGFSKGLVMFVQPTSRLGFHRAGRGGEIMHLQPADSYGDSMS